MAENPVQELLAGRREETQAQLGIGSGAGFLESAISSMGPELLGFDPSPNVTAWRVRNPVAGIGSQFLGFGVPYLGWMKAARAIPKFNAFISTLGEGAPMALRTALRSGARFAPFEAGRVGLSAVLGGDVGDVAQEAGVNLLLEAGLGGIGGALKSFARTNQRRVMQAAGTSGADSMQVQAQKIAAHLELMEGGKVATSDEAIGQTREALSNLRNAIRQQEPLKDSAGNLRKYTEGNFEIGGTGVGGAGSPAARGNAREFNRLLALPATPILRNRSSRHIRDVISTEALKVLGGIHLLDNMQFARELLFRAGSVKPFYERRLARMQQVAVDGWIAKEHNDGLWIVAKRIHAGGLKFNRKEAYVQGAADHHRFVIFKTDRPELFFPENALWAKNVRDKIFDVETIQAGLSGGPIVKKLVDMGNLVDYRIVGGTPKGGLSRLAAKTGVDKLVDSGPMQALGQIANRSLKPAMFQFGRNLRATRAHTIMSEVFEEARQQANLLLYGKAELGNITSGYKLALTGGGLSGGAIQKILASSDEARAALPIFLQEAELLKRQGWKFGDEAALADQMFRAGQITSEGRDLIKVMAMADAGGVKINLETYAAFGLESGLQPLFGHLMIPRSWEGKWRATIERENGDLVYMVGAHDAGTAERLAKDYIARTGLPGMRVRSVYPSDSAADMHSAVRMRQDAPEYRKLAEIERLLNMNIARPRTYKRRPEDQTPGALTDKVLTAKQLAEIVTTHVTDNMTHLAELTTRRGLLNEFDRLKLEDPDLLEQLLRRIDDKVGRPGPLSKIINRATDAVLAPIIGPNSASKIVHTANKLMYHWDLGMMNIMFPVVNALTFVQTTLPHTAFVLTAHRDVSQLMHSTMPVAGADGLIKGAVSWLDPIKLAGRSLMLLRNLDKDPLFKEAVERGMNHSMFTPKFVENFSGENATRLGNIKSALTTRGGFVDAMEAISSFAPSATERFSRLHSFGIGWLTARDIMKLDPDRAFQFAKEFTEKTMFLYSTADRARIITGPLGTFFGLFKNWQMHYIGQMMTYASEGALRGNWAPLLWQTAGTWAMAGAKGVPGFALADRFAQWAGEESALTAIYEMFGGAGRDTGDNPMPDAIYHGLPGLIGLSLTGSTGAPFSDPARDASQLMTFVHLDRMKALAAAVGGGIDAWSTTGQHPIRDDETRRQFMRALAPRSIYRALSVGEGNFIQSLSTGYPSVGGLSMGERVLYGMGFSPRWVSLQFDAQRELWSKQENLRAAIANYGQLITEAKAERDYRMVTQLQAQAIARNLPLDSIWQSVNTREAKARDDTIGRQFSGAETLPYRRAGLV